MTNAVEPDYQKDLPDRYIRRVVMTITIVGMVYLAWQIREVTMIIFGGVLIATLLTALAEKAIQHTPLPEKAALGVVIFLIVLTLGVVVWWIGDNILIQIEELKEKLPNALDASKEWLEETPLGSVVTAQWDGMSSIAWADLAGFTGTALGALANAVLIIAIGVYLAASPRMYGDGLVRLFPVAYRDKTKSALLMAGKGLRSWLIGQIAIMFIVGTLTAIGLYLLDIPLALSLGIIAGLLEFIPFIGPVVFGVLAILLAFTESPTAAFNVALLTLVLQQIEGNILTPIIQRHTVKLPPALGLVAVVIFGVLFGIPGILFATPLMVVVMILVKRLYVKEALEDGVSPDGYAAATPDHAAQSSSAHNTA